LPPDSSQPVLRPHHRGRASQAGAGPGTPQPAQRARGSEDHASHCARDGGQARSSVGCLPSAGAWAC